jgi:hypothetical protein
MSELKKYQLGFDVWGLVLFLAVMAPNFIWFAVPAPNDVLRTESVTPAVDMVASVCQVMLVACLCFVVRKERRRFRLSALVIATLVCLAVYYAGWVLYWCGIADWWVILMLTVPPCAAFILFEADRGNLPALVFASLFTVCHLIFGILNFMI